MNSQSPGSPNWDNLGGVLGLKAIQMWVLRSNTNNNIWGKVVASPESGPW